MSDVPRRRPEARTPPRKAAPRALSDGRVQMLVYLPPAVVKAVKRVALEQDTSASHIVERALDRWLTQTARRPTPDPSARPTPARGRTGGQRPDAG